MLKNYTPHVVRFQAADGSVTEYPSEGVARVETKGSVQIGTIDGMPVFSSPSFGEVYGLPEYQPGGQIHYIVSSVVKAAANRDDLVSPGTGPADGCIRVDGQPYAVTRWIA